MAKSAIKAKTKLPTPKGKPEVAAAAAGSQSIVQLKKSALSLDIGPMVIMGLAKANEEEAKLNQLAENIKNKRYDLLAQTTQAIVKAGKADQSIDLSAVFSGDPKRMASLNDQLGLALGFREIVVTAEDKNGISWEKVTTAKVVAKYFPMAGEDVKSDEYKKKNTLRTNFLHLLKKCAGAAMTIIEKDIVSKYDAKQGTLVISGPAVKKHFGHDNIPLDEKKIRGEGDSSIELNEKPSFTAVAAMGAAEAGGSAGTVGRRGVQSEAAKATAAAAAATGATTRTTPDQAIVSICKALITAIEKFPGKLSSAVKDNLEAVNNAIDVKLANG